MKYENNEGYDSIKTQFEEMHTIASSEVEQPKDYVMRADDFLKEAQRIMNERGKTYDSDNKERSMSKTIAAFNAITSNRLKESDGWLLMKLLKDVRQYSKPDYHHDSAIDSVAYSALHAESLNNYK